LTFAELEVLDVSFDEETTTGDVAAVDVVAVVP